jgi:hypothetical protein
MATSLFAYFATKNFIYSLSQVGEGHQEESKNHNCNFLHFRIS